MHSPVDDQEDKIDEDHRRRPPPPWGSMLYIRIEKGLKIYGFTVLKDLKELILDIGIDGFTIACSSGLCGWPILGAVVVVFL